jgi:uncharacterized protein (TIGR03118 family)
MFSQPSIGRIAGFVCALALVCASTLLFADEFTQTNLVSDVPNLAAITDPNLKNPWGASFSATSPFWVSNQASGTATLYNGAGAITPLVVTIPGGMPPSGPTGQVNNSVGAGTFPVNGTASSFIFDTLNGTVDAWNAATGTTAVQVASTSGAVYTGLALGTVGTTPYLYAADSTGQIHVFNANWGDVTGTTFAGKFVDPTPIAGFVPFNIQLIGSDLYVTYAHLSGPTGLPGGYVDIFDTSGNFIKRVATNGPLYAPWGLVIAPVGFGSFGNDLLVGNFGNGEILAYDPATDALLGTIDGPNGQPLVNPFLWALETRIGGTGSDLNAVYFTAGINNQNDGLFGKIDPIPEPATILETASGLIALALLRRRHTASFNKGRIISALLHSNDNTFTSLHSSKHCFKRLKHH